MSKTYWIIQSVDSSWVGEDKTVYSPYSTSPLLFQTKEEALKFIQDNAEEYKNLLFAVPVLLSSVDS
jgi:hypothetical protein